LLIATPAVEVRLHAHAAAHITSLILLLLLLLLPLPLLLLANATAHLQLKPGYMHTLRRHSLCRRLVQELLQELLKQHRAIIHGDAASLGMLGTAMAQVQGLQLLKLYRLVRESIQGMSFWGVGFDPSQLACYFSLLFGRAALLACSQHSCVDAHAASSK
jgi:hypothetical protein